MSSPTSTHFPLLQLPLEIRLMIYDISHKIYIATSLEPNGHRYQCKRNLDSPLQDLKITANDQQLPRRRMGTPKIGFFALRQANHQVAEETLRFIQFPRIRLHITDDLTFTLCSAEKTLEFMSQWLLRENTEEVFIDFRLDGVAGRQPQTTKRLMKGSLLLIKYLYMFLRSLIQKCNFRLMAGLLKSFPKLKKLRFSSRVGGFFNLWLDPVGDIRVLSSLVRKDVVVEFSLPNGYESIFERRVSDPWRCLRKRLIGSQLQWKHVERRHEYNEGENITAIVYILQ